MPQLDPYIFYHQIITLFFIFFLIYIYVRKNILPKLNSILKYRSKKINKLFKHDRGNWRLFNESKLYFSFLGVNYLSLISDRLPNILIKYKIIENLDYRLFFSDKFKSIELNEKNIKENKSTEFKHSLYYFKK